MRKSPPLTHWEDVPLILDIKMAARLLGRCPESIKQLCREGLLPAFKIGNEWRIDKDELRAFMKQGRATVPTPTTRKEVAVCTS